MGRSIYYRETVSTLIGERFRVTLYVGSLALILGSVLGIFFGVISALRRGTWLDTLFMSLANIGISAPNFWLGILLIYFVGFKLGWLPIHGYTSPFEDFVHSTKQLIMPVFVLSVFGMSGLARQTRSSMLEVVRQDYIRTAWAKGLKERSVVLKHVLKNGLVASITMVGMAVPITLGGQVIVENVFSIPGMGRLLVTSTLAQDYPVVQVGILVIAISVIVANLLVDICYGWLDPRIRYDQETVT